MRKNWFPLAISKEMRTGQVYPVKLFDEPLVLFRDNNGSPVCLQDRCPHRSTPLSLGRLSEGSLECGYHGWRFGKEGQCLLIPSEAKGSTRSQKVAANYRACIEREGMVWVWGDAPETANEAQFRDAALAPLKEDGMYSYLYNFEMPVPHEVVVENLLDPAHVPFTHHGTFSRRDFAHPIELNDLDDEHAMFAGYCSVETPRGAAVPTEKVILKFYDPCTVVLDILGKSKNGKPSMRSYQVHYCVPVGPKQVRLFSYYGQTFLKSFQRLLEPIFRKMAAKALSQDIGILKAQTAAFEAGAPTYGRVVGADRLSLVYRRWLERQLSESPWFAGFGPQSPARGSSVDAPCE